ncbi:ATP-grasp domain-containing protein, partial [Lutimaribacter sp. EGI FJ00015]|nr:ATP-grasp domain-containing protein [Lutimaribacter sp. EGI FJ00015]
MVANRGEIPIRIFRSAHELSMRTIAIYSHEDRLSMHRLKADEAYVIGEEGQYTPVGAYLAMDEIIEIAKKHKVDFIHPGYGFLSENSEFADKVVKAGITWIGPPAEVIDSVGDKVSARHLAARANVPTVPGTPGPIETVQEALDFVNEYGYPVIIKAAFGGGGRGMRVVREGDDVADAFQRATSEARTAFGNGTCFVERFLDKPKHIEVQLLADNHGNVVHLFERDCSVQRRHQKVVEVAPAKTLPREVRDAILTDAVKLAKECGYRNAGT